MVISWQKHNWKAKSTPIKVGWRGVLAQRRPWLHWHSQIEKRATKNIAVYVEKASRALWTRRGDPWGTPNSTRTRDGCKNPWLVHLKEGVCCWSTHWQQGTLLMTCSEAPKRSILYIFDTIFGILLHAFITSHLDCCNLILFGVPSKALDNSRMNYASRVLSGTKASH